MVQAGHTSIEQLLSVSSKLTTISPHDRSIKVLYITGSQLYLSQLPIAAIQYLDKGIDWDNDYDRDLTEIAKDLLKWEELLAAPFRLTRSDSHRIRSTNQQSPELQMLVTIKAMVRSLAIIHCILHTQEGGLAHMAVQVWS